MSQFGGSSQEDDYGYFGSAKPAAGGSQFGGPVAGQSPFGAPPSTAPGASPTFGGTSPFGTPTGMGGTGYPSNTPPIPQRRKPWLRAALALVLAVGALWLGNFVWDMHQISKPIAMPSTLGGRSAQVDPRLQTLANDALTSIRASNPGRTIEAQIYGTNTDLAIAVVARGHLDVNKEWADVGSPVTSKIGKSECAIISNGPSAVCIRSSRTLAVEVVVVGGTVTDAAAGVDQMWAAQP